MIRTLDEASAWLEGLLDVEKRPDVSYARFSLAPVRALCERLALSLRHPPAIHVAGSKGKGSTALLAEAIARACGARVGTFTSPHLERWTERFRIDGCEVDGERLAAAVERLRPHVEALRQRDREAAPTFFDATTAAALSLFDEARVDLRILEVGLGGRLDSTNVVVPRVACITSIELEHTDKLGDTLAAIAAEKAGVLKPGVPAVIGVLPEEAAAVVRARAREVDAPLAWAGRDFHSEILGTSGSGQRVSLRDGLATCEVELPLLGAHQAANAALALACVRRALPISDAELAAAARRALVSVRLPGRLEFLSRAPDVLIDSSHTAASARALANVLAGLPRRATHLVLSVSAGKDLEAILAALLPEASRVTVTRAEPTRSLSPEAIAAAVGGRWRAVPLRVVPNPHLALRAARAGLAPGELLCVAGSVYLAGLARRVLREGRRASAVSVQRRAPGEPLGDP